jgi:hypothetical protein
VFGLVGGLRLRLVWSTPHASLSIFFFKKNILLAVSIGHSGLFLHSHLGHGGADLLSTRQAATENCMLSKAVQTEEDESRPAAATTMLPFSLFNFFLLPVDKWCGQISAIQLLWESAIELGLI